MTHSTAKGRRPKPRKTRPKSKAEILQAARDYKREHNVPLMAHTSLRWCRKINGRLCYYGAVDPAADDFGAGAALGCYDENQEDDRAGRVRREHRDGITVDGLCQRFLHEWKGRVATGELHERSWRAYKRACIRVVNVFGRHRQVADLRAEDFGRLRQRLAADLAPTTLSVEIARVKTLFGYAFDAELIDKPVRFGSSFRPPAKRVLRQARNGQGSRMFQPDEIHKLLKAAKRRMKPMILLAINAGLGPGDLGRMTFDHLDLEGGWLDYPRHKTGVGRRAKLWSETCEAVREYLKHRPKPNAKDLEERVFLSRTGSSLYALNGDPIGRTFRTLLKSTGLYRKQRSMYGLRRSHRTASDGARDPVACDVVMGHSDPTMGGLYRQSIEDSRLERVAQVVHDWLFGAAKAE